MQPAAYWRSTKEWQQWLGKTGVVVATTRVHVAAPELAAHVPYSYCIVEIDGERKEFIGADHQELAIGDAVHCVLRRMQKPSQHGLIMYGIKVEKVHVERTSS